MLVKDRVALLRGRIAIAADAVAEIQPEHPYDVMTDLGCAVLAILAHGEACVTGPDADGNREVDGVGLLLDEDLWFAVLEAVDLLSDEVDDDGADDLV